ncbi:unnamed protein product, partial [Scytosiphon promiscuus]
GAAKERQGREGRRSPRHTRGQPSVGARVTASTAADSAVNHEAQLRVWSSRASSR